MNDVEIVESTRFEEEITIPPAEGVSISENGGPYFRSELISLVRLIDSPSPRPHVSPTTIAAKAAGDGLPCRVGILGDFLWCPRRDFEVVAGDHKVVAEHPAGDLAAVGTVAESLGSSRSEEEQEDQRQCVFCDEECLARPHKHPPRRRQLTTIAGSPEYSYLMLPQKQLPVGIL